MLRAIAGLTLLLGANVWCAAEPSSQPAAAPLAVEQQTLFAAGQGKFNNYRIPALIVTKQGTVLAFCEGRQNVPGPTNDSGEINLLLRRSTDGGKTFSEPQVVWADGQNTCGNPCPVVDESTGQILLLGTHNMGTDREKMISDGTAQGTRTVWIITSDDDGKTWSKARDITESTKKKEWTWYATGPGIGIQIKHGPHAGRLVIPCDYGLHSGTGPGNAHVIYSDDHGKTWHIGGEPTNHAYNESQIVELADGVIELNMRNLGRGKNSATQRGLALSTDGGETFGEGKPDDTLVEPKCQGSIFRYSWPEDGKSRLLFSNPASATERKLMTVRASYDDGKTWPVQKLIYAGWTGYSCLTKLPDGSIGLFYEAGNDARYQRIDFARFTLEQLTDGKDLAAAH